MKPRPTTATFTLLEVLGDLVIGEFSSGKVFFNNVSGRANVSDALRPGFAFDDKISGELQLFQRFKKGAPIHLAGSDGNFFAPCARNLRAKRVLDMHLVN